jgi:gamma-glutamyltranspeptidase/glutathione hydrolase
MLILNEPWAAVKSLWGDTDLGGAHAGAEYGRREISAFTNGYAADRIPHTDFRNPESRGAAKDGGGMPHHISAKITWCIVVTLLIAMGPAAFAGDGLQVCARGGTVVTASPPATAVGVDILRRGGNAVDAAVAVGFALAVTYPQAGNIGGGGFMLVRLGSGESSFIDFRETAPRDASRDMYLDSLGNVVDGLSTVGALAAGVPGTVAGLYAAHEKHGSLPWRDLVEPAIGLARDGFPVSEKLASALRSLQEYKSRFPGLSQFMRNDGAPLAPGDTLRQPALARTLERIAAEGPAAFYRGGIADEIVEEMRMSGGIVSKEDLVSYEATPRTPVTGSYRGCEIISAPPPSSGGTVLIEILNILEGYDLSGMAFMNDRTIHYVVEAERRAYADRARYLGDPDFTDNRTALLTSKEYASQLRESITPRATPSAELSARPAVDREKRETTHYSIVDGGGNAVAVTYTLNDSFGSKVVVRGAGFLLNNEMDDFSIKPGHPNLYGLVGSEANAIEPGKRMLSSMAPTMVLRDGRLFLVLGTPGGATIITTIAQLIIDVVDFDMSLEAAVAAPRFHHQWLPDVISVERGAFGAYLRRSLVEKGHLIRDRATPIGDAQAIEVTGSTACGVSDPRGDGAPGGVEPAGPDSR